MSLQGEYVMMGEKKGSETVQVSAANLPPHTHVAAGPYTTSSRAAQLGGVVLEACDGEVDCPEPTTVQLDAIVGGSYASSTNVQPYLAVNFVINICDASEGDPMLAAITVRVLLLHIHAVLRLPNFSMKL